MTMEPRQNLEWQLCRWLSAREARSGTNYRRAMLALLASLLVVPLPALRYRASKANEP